MAVGLDTAEGMEERAILALPIVTTLPFVRAVKDKARGFWVSLTCYGCTEYCSCEKSPKAPIHLLRERTTMLAWLQSCENDWRRNMAKFAEALTKKAAVDARAAAPVSADMPDVTQAMMQLEQAKNQHLLLFFHARASCYVFLFYFLVCRGTMRGGHTTVGARHARVCEVEESDPPPVEQISWCKVVHVPSRPFGEKTNLLSQHHQGFGIATRGLKRLW